MTKATLPGIERQRTCPFTVAIDHREQLPYSFSDLPPKAAWRGRLYVPTERTHLATGDYTIRGLEDRFGLERKSLADLYSTIGQARERFEAELDRLNAMEFAAIIIEATMPEAWNPAKYHGEWISRLNPRAADCSLVAWEIRYPRVHVWHVGSRVAGEVRAFEAMEQFWRKVQHEADDKTTISDEARQVLKGAAARVITRRVDRISSVWCLLHATDAEDRSAVIGEAFRLLRTAAGCSQECLGNVLYRRYSSRGRIVDPEGLAGLLARAADEDAI